MSGPIAANYDIVIGLPATSH